jgi:hypothetical protein
VSHLKRLKQCHLQTYALYTFKGNDFFLRTADHNQWHCSKCVPVPKSGDLSDPNTWCGVMLMDFCSEIFSSVMNGHEFKLLKKKTKPVSNLGAPLNLAAMMAYLSSKLFSICEKIIASHLMLHLLTSSKPMTQQIMSFS